MSVEPEEQAIPAEESQEQEPAEDYAGYGSLEEMKRGVYESRKEGKRLAEQNAVLASQLAHVARLLPSERAEARKSALEELNDLGLPAETFRAAMREELKEELHKELAPMQRTTAAVANIRATHPTFSKVESDFNRWLQANSEVADTFNKAVEESPNSADLLLLGVFAKFEQTRRPGTTDGEPRKVSPNAKLPNSQAGGTVRREPPNKMDAEEYTALIKEARRTGDPIAMIRALTRGQPIHRDIEKAKQR